MTTTIYVDGCCEPVNPSGYACFGWTALDDDGSEIMFDYGLLLSGDGATNNLAEYGALVKALRWAKAEGLRGVQIYSDSQLMVNQVNDTWMCNKELLIKARDVARRVMAEVEATLTWVPRQQNERADELSRQAYREELAREVNPNAEAYARQRALYAHNRQRAT